MRLLVSLFLMLCSISLWAKQPSTITCIPYGNVWFGGGDNSKNKLEVRREYGKLNGHNLNIVIDFNKGIVLNRWGNKRAKEIIIHSVGNAYYIKGMDKTIYYGTYTFSNGYRTAIYTSDGNFASFLECKTNNAL